MKWNGVTLCFRMERVPAKYLRSFALFTLSLLDKAMRDERIGYTGMLLMRHHQDL